MAKRLHSTVDIDATPDQVWAVLTDFAHYPEWNPFLTEVEGEPVVGARLHVRFAPPGGKAMTMQPRVTAAEPGRAFEWLGRVGVPGIFDGRHRFELQATGGGTTFVQRETFTGVLARPVLRLIGAKTEAGFQAMNAALKRRVEHATTARP